MPDFPSWFILFRHCRQQQAVRNCCRGKIFAGYEQEEPDIVRPMSWSLGSLAPPFALWRFQFHAIYFQTPDQTLWSAYYLASLWLSLDSYSSRCDPNPRFSLSQKRSQDLLVPNRLGPQLDVLLFIFHFFRQEKSCRPPLQIQVQKGVRTS